MIFSGTSTNWILNYDLSNIVYSHNSNYQFWGIQISNFLNFSKIGQYSGKLLLGSVCYDTKTWGVSNYNIQMLCCTVWEGNIKLMVRMIDMKVEKYYSGFCHVSFAALIEYLSLLMNSTVSAGVIFTAVSVHWPPNVKMRKVKGEGADVPKSDTFRMIELNNEKN